MRPRRQRRNSGRPNRRRRHRPRLRRPRSLAATGQPEGIMLLNGRGGSIASVAGRSGENVKRVFQSKARNDVYTLDAVLLSVCFEAWAQIAERLRSLAVSQRAAQSAEQSRHLEGEVQVLRAELHEAKSASGKVVVTLRSELQELQAELQDARRRPQEAHYQRHVEQELAYLVTQLEAERAQLQALMERQQEDLFEASLRGLRPSCPSDSGAASTLSPVMSEARWPAANQEDVVVLERALREARQERDEARSELTACQQQCMQQTSDLRRLIRLEEAEVTWSPTLTPGSKPHLNGSGVTNGNGATRAGTPKSQDGHRESEVSPFFTSRARTSLNYSTDTESDWAGSFPLRRMTSGNGSAVTPAAAGAAEPKPFADSSAPVASGSRGSAGDGGGESTSASPFRRRGTGGHDSSAAWTAAAASDLRPLASAAAHAPGSHPAAHAAGGASASASPRRRFSGSHLPTAPAVAAAAGWAVPPVGSVAPAATCGASSAERADSAQRYAPRWRDDASQARVDPAGRSWSSPARDGAAARGSSSAPAPFLLDAVGDNIDSTMLMFPLPTMAVAQAWMGAAAEAATPSGNMVLRPRRSGSADFGVEAGDVPMGRRFPGQVRHGSPSSGMLGGDGNGCWGVSPDVEGCRSAQSGAVLGDRDDCWSVSANVGAGDGVMFGEAPGQISPRIRQRGRAGHPLTVVQAAGVAASEALYPEVSRTVLYDRSAAHQVPAESEQHYGSGAGPSVCHGFGPGCAVSSSSSSSATAANGARPAVAAAAAGGVVCEPRASMGPSPLHKAASRMDHLEHLKGSRPRSRVSIRRRLSSPAFGSAQGSGAPASQAAGVAAIPTMSCAMPAAAAAEPIGLLAAAAATPPPPPPRVAALCGAGGCAYVPVEHLGRSPCTAPRPAALEPVAAAYVPPPQPPLPARQEPLAAGPSQVFNNLLSQSRSRQGSPIRR